MPEVALDMPRLWVEFTDPEDDGQRFRCDLTWLTSSWTCIYGNGCQGIYADRPDDGCCTLGAHFTEDADLERVRAVAGELGPDEWQLRDEAVDAGGGLPLDGWTELEDGVRKTRVVDGACIFLNRPGFPAGQGCSLHQHAVLQGKPATMLKPEVCWQLPIRRAYRTVEQPDDSSYLEVTITEYDRRGWGPGGHDLDWYCSGNPEAHVGREPVYRSSKAELVELMGEGAYEQLVVRCEAHLRSVQAAWRTGNRKLLPLLVHPATLAAQDEAAAGGPARKAAIRAAAEKAAKGKPGKAGKASKRR
ncbi:hypothetical protein [Lapillicoccus jejuensis]|uniref:DUF3109 family protein n=1 Tax=Lapillicoccus jejuensis TaxID=402171 RepID=A0A542DXB6_9MICO|nr:hypothetical protein [Lapillicoccus jejuensis]TQJ07728.1 hypothetical protein FB458_0796 [Lapillicoccus jejuensis]